MGTETNGKAVATNGKPARVYDLIRLAAEIKDALERAVKSEWDRLDYYRSAGEGLNRAKELVPHGDWGTWLKDNFEWKSDRQAQKYMKFANAPRKADLEDEKRAWRDASGATGKPKGKPEPKVTDDGSRGIEMTALPKPVADEFDRLVIDLIDAEDDWMDDGLRSGMGESDPSGINFYSNTGVVVAALRYVHRAVCGRADKKPAAKKLTPKERAAKRRARGKGVAVAA